MALVQHRLDSLKQRCARRAELVLQCPVGGEQMTIQRTIPGARRTLVQRTGYGPENTTRLRRFAIELIKARGLNVAETLRRLNRNVRCVLDFLKMTANCQPKLNRLNAPPYRHPAPGSPPGPQPRALTTRDHQTQSAHSPHPHAPSLRTASPTSHDNRHKRRDAINLRKNQRMN